MDETRDAIDELREYADTCATREGFDRLIAKIEQERDKLLRSLDMARESRDRKAARLEFLSERGILLAVDGQGGMELVIDPERCRHDEDRVMRVNDYRQLKDERDDWRAKAEQAMESYQDAKDSRDELQRELADLSEERGFVPATDEEMAKHGWTRLPSDMDGTPICVGDKIEHEKRRGTVTAICRTHAFSSISALFDGDEESEEVMPYEVLHYHEPTVADALREFALMCEERGHTDPSIDGIVDKYASKLRLAEVDA